MLRVLVLLPVAANVPLPTTRRVPGVIPTIPSPRPPFLLLAVCPAPSHPHEPPVRLRCGRVSCGVLDMREPTAADTVRLCMGLVQVGRDVRVFVWPVCVLMA